MTAPSAGDALPYPIYGYRYRVTGPIFAMDGSRITDGDAWGTVDLDHGDPVASTNTPVQLGSSGDWFLDLEPEEMEASTVTVQIATDAMGATPTTFVLYPRRLAKIADGQCLYSLTAFNEIGFPVDFSSTPGFYRNMIVGLTSGDGAGQARWIISYAAPNSKIATLSADWGVKPEADDYFEVFATAESGGSSAQAALTDTDELQTKLSNMIEADGDGWRWKPAALAGVFLLDMADVEPDAPEDSLCTLVLACFHFDLSQTTWTIYRTDDETTHRLVPVALDAEAAPIIGANRPE